MDVSNNTITVSSNTINIDGLNLDYIVYDEINNFSNYTIDTANYIIDTSGTTINTFTTSTSTYTPTTTTVVGNGTVFIDGTFDFNGWTQQPGFLVDLGDDEDGVHYTHEEATEALKDHHNEKKLRKEHKMLEKAYKEYKMLARLLQVDVVEDDEESR